MSLADLRSLAATCHAFRGLLDDLLQWHTIRLSLDSPRWSEVRQAGTAKKIKALAIHPDTISSSDGVRPPDKAAGRGLLGDVASMPHLNTISWVDGAADTLDWKKLFATSVRSCPNLIEFQALGRYSLLHAEPDDLFFEDMRKNWLPLHDQPSRPALKRFVAFSTSHPTTEIEDHGHWFRRCLSVTDSAPLLSRCQDLEDITVSTWPPNRFENLAPPDEHQGALDLTSLGLPKLHRLTRLEVNDDYCVETDLLAMCENLGSLEVLLLPPASPHRAHETPETSFGIPGDALPNLRIFRGDLAQISAIVAPSSVRRVKRIEGLLLRSSTVLCEPLLNGLSQQDTLTQLSVFLQRPPRGGKNLRLLLAACPHLTMLFVGCDEHIRQRSVEELLPCFADLQQLRKVRLPIQDLIFSATAGDTGTMTLRVGPRQPSFLSGLRQRVRLFGNQCKRLERIDFGSTAGYSQITRYWNSPSRQVSDVTIEGYNRGMEDGHDGWTGAWREFWEDGDPSFSPFEADLQRYPELMKPLISRML